MTCLVIDYNYHRYLIKITFFLHQNEALQYRPFPQGKSRLDKTAAATVTVDAITKNTELLHLLALVMNIYAQLLHPLLHSLLALVSCAWLLPLCSVTNVHAMARGS